MWSRPNKQQQAIPGQLSRPGHNVYYGEAARHSDLPAAAAAVKSEVSRRRRSPSLRSQSQIARALEWKINTQNLSLLAAVGLTQEGSRTHPLDDCSAFL